MKNQHTPMHKLPCEHMLCLVGTACRPIQDSNCNELREGERVTALYEIEDDMKYYDAVVLRAERHEHGTGE